MGEPVEPARLPDEVNLSSKKSSSQARAFGYASGIGGTTGALAWFNSDKARRAVDGVPPATGRGFVHAVLWCIGFGLAVAACRLLLPVPPAVSGGIALAIMFVVGSWWARHFGIRRDMQ